MLSLNPVLASLPLGLRIIAIPVSYWLIALVPLAIQVFRRDWDFGFTRDKLGLQILTGILLGIVLSLLLTLIPHLAGFGGFVDNGSRYQYGWQFAYEFGYCILGVGCVEEGVFRGFIYGRFQRIGRKESIAVIGSSILFGVFHLLSGGPLQMVVTALIGALFCLFRLKLKHCSLLSLMLAHGMGLHIFSGLKEGPVLTDKKHSPLTQVDPMPSAVAASIMCVATILASISPLL